MPNYRQMQSYSQGPTLAQTVLLVFKWLCLAFMLILLSIFLYVAVRIWLQVQDIPPLSSLESYDRGDPIQIFDRYDHLVCTFKGEENRKRVSLDQISPAMRWATLAAEDHTFYEHHGISPVGMLRASLKNLHAGHVVEGGSTITQQLVKNLFFEQARRTLDRKMAEAYIAWELERRYSKDQILEMYLNEAYFGNGAYGIEQAARYYFAKPASQLRISEGAFLAGLIKSPSRLGAMANRSLAVQEQLEVIDKMVKYGFLSPLRAQHARFEPMRFWQKPDNSNKLALKNYPYYISYVLDLVHQRFTPGDIRAQGLRIYTALDPVVQETAERSLRQGISQAPAGVTQGGLATVSVNDGSVLALVGGVGDYEQQQYNCATHGHTAGSAFKPFVYVAAFDYGVLTPESSIDDTPLTVDMSDKTEWKPKNFDGKFMGEITVREALVYSRNVCSVRIAQRVGIENVIDAARRAGIRENLKPNLSLSLGSTLVSPLEMAGAYATFARQGVAIYPWVLRRIDNRNGHVVQTFEQPKSRAFGSEAVDQLVGILREVVTGGTGIEANIPNLFVAGKTGTADQAKDLWFVGFTPDLVTAVWGGNNEGQPVPGSNITGGTVMARIWKSYTGALYDNQELARNGLIRHSTAETAVAAPLPRSPSSSSIKKAAPPLVQQPADADSAGSRVISAPDGGKIILRMQQGKLDERSTPSGQEAPRFKL